MKIEMVFWMGTTIMLFLAIALISLTLFYQNNIFKIKRKEAELLLKASLESERHERQRIAADLHDGVLGDLAALRVYATLMHKNNNSLSENDEFINFKLGIEDAIENTRLVSYKLMPPLLESHGLVIALEDYYNRLNYKTTTRFTINCHESIPLSILNEYELFRVLQELSINIVKHGEASYCQITFTATNEFINVEITDDGKIYDFNELCITSKGNGMKNILSRLQSINGTLLQKDTEQGNCLLLIIKKPC